MAAGLFISFCALFKNSIYFLPEFMANIFQEQILQVTRTHKTPSNRRNINISVNMAIGKKMEKS